MTLELRKEAVSHFQYLSSRDNTSTPHYRYSPPFPYDWLSKDRLPWNAFDSPEPWLTQPYKYQLDRPIALVSYRNVTQGAYMCANAGKCTSPDVCSCAKGWIGYDCRVPVCEQVSPYRCNHHKGVGLPSALERQTKVLPGNTTNHLSVHVVSSFTAYTCRGTTSHS